MNKNLIIRLTLAAIIIGGVYILLFSTGPGANNLAQVSAPPGVFQQYDYSIRVGWKTYANAVNGLFTDFIHVQAANLPQVAEPTIFPNGGDLLTKDQITISAATTGATIYYTINGTTPTTSSYLYNGFVDLQPGGTYFNIGTYIVRAIAIKSGYSNSNVVLASFNVTNRDKIQRKFLSDQQISVNHDDCWTADKTSCTSLSDIRAATLNEIGYFAQACDSWNNPSGSYANRCGVFVTGGTEAGHAGTGICSHIGGSKFDMRIETLVSNYILTPAYFIYLGLRSDGSPMYKWMSGGAVYARESSPDHWDVLVGCQ